MTVEESMPTPENKPAIPLEYAGRRSRSARRIPLVVWCALGVLVIAWNGFFLLPLFSLRFDRSPILKCRSNLKQIGQAMFLYANDFQGRYPDKIGDLLEEEITPSIFVCPTSTDTPATTAPSTQASSANVHAGGHLSYIYLGKGLTDKVPADTVLVYEPLANHGNGMNVLYGDGHVDFINIKQAAWMLAELKAGYNPPRPQPAAQAGPSPSSIP